jgi:predicted HNH restriction endonuclease
MKMQLDSWTYEQLSGLANSVLGRSADFTPHSVDELFAWAIKGSDADTQEVVQAIKGGVLSFSESQDINAIEGGRRLVVHLRIERDPAIAREAVRRHVRDDGLVCKLCVLDFSRRYQMGAGEHCLEAHHKLPLSLRLVASQTNLEDFLVICPSCHRVIHKKRAFDQESLAKVLRTVA